jgi:hypothetical protein
MGIKKSFIEMIKSGYPDFDPQNDTVMIEFEGDSFGSLPCVTPYREGSLDLSTHSNFLFQIIDESDVEYDKNSADNYGKIEYNINSEEEITVSTIVIGKYWGEIYEEEEEDMKIWDTTLGDGLDDEMNYNIYWDGTVEGTSSSQKI